MRSFFTLALFALISLKSLSQTGWFKQRVGNELSVSFPQKPSSDSKPEKRLTLFVFKADNSGCMYTVLLRENAMTNYEKVKNLPLPEKEKEINSFLDKGIKEFIQDSKVIRAQTSILIGAFIGKEMTYSQQSNTGQWFTQYTKFVFANNNLYIIQCSEYKEGSCLNDKNIFLDSITSN